MEIINQKDKIEYINKRFKFPLPQWYIDDMDYKKTLRNWKGELAFKTSPYFEMCEVGARTLGICGFRKGKDDFKEDAVNDEYGICDFVRKSANGCRIYQHKYNLMVSGDADGLLVWDWVGGYPHQMKEEFNTKNGKGWKAGDVPEMELIQFIPRQIVLNTIERLGGFKDGMYITSFV